MQQIKRNSRNTPTTLLQEHAKAAIERFGGATKAAGALSINRSVLVLLASGQRTSASPKTLRKLGLRRVPQPPVIEPIHDSGEHQ